jgi:type IV pilus assembly protein PilV
MNQAAISHTSTIRRAERGVALLESLLAVMILGIALVGTLGLQARSIAALSDAGMRAEATVAANELLGIMYSDMPHAADYALAAGGTPGARLAAWHAAVQDRIPGAGVVVGVATNATVGRTEVNIAIGWQRTSDSQRNTHRIKSYLTASKP